MIALPQDGDGQVAPRLPRAIAEQGRCEAPTMPGADQLVVAEMALVHQSAFVRAKTWPDLDLIGALAAQEQLDRPARHALHAAHGTVRELDAQRSAERRQAYVVGQAV